MDIVIKLVKNVLVHLNFNVKLATNLISIISQFQMDVVNGAKINKTNLVLLILEYVFNLVKTKHKISGVIMVNALKKIIVRFS